MKAYLYQNYHRSFIDNSPILEIIQMFLSRQLDKLWYSHAVEYYSAAERNEQLTAKWMNIKIIMLNERR